MPFQTTRDPFGVARLVEQIRLNRREAEERPIREMQTELLSGKVQQQRANLSQLAQQRKEQGELRQILQSQPDQDPDRLTLDFYKRRNPQRATQMVNSIFQQAGKILPVAGGKSAVDFVNAKTGMDLEYQGVEEDTGLMKIGSPSAGKVMLYDMQNDQIVKEFEFPVRGAETIEVGPEGTKITRGGLQVEKFKQKQQEKQVKKAERRRQALGKINIVTNKVDEALAQTGMFTTGLLGAPMRAIPGTAARDLKGTIDTIQANLGFTALQQMREASPTGGALGAVSERELTLLNSAVSSLDPSQSPDTIRRNLEQVRTHFNNWKDSIVEARAKEIQSEVPGITDDDLLDRLESEGL